VRIISVILTVSRRTVVIGDFLVKYTNLVYCALGMAVPKLYWKVFINGKWTFRKAHFYREPKEWEFTHEIVPYRMEEM